MERTEVITQINAAVAVAILALTLAIAFIHCREYGWRNHVALLGIGLVLLGMVNVVTAVPAAFDLSGHIATRFIAGALRGAVLVLLLAYVWHRFSERR